MATQTTSNVKFLLRQDSSLVAKRALLRLIIPVPSHVLYIAVGGTINKGIYPTITSQGDIPDDNAICCML